MASTLSKAASQQILEAFQGHTNEVLTRMARVFTTKPPPSKQGLSECLLEQLVPPRLAQTLTLVGADGRALLASAAHGNRLLCAAQRQVPKLVTGSWARSYSYYRPNIPPSPVLAFFPDGHQMPQPLRKLLAELLPAPPLPPLQRLAGDPPGQLLCADATSDISMILHLAEAGALEATKTGVAASSLKRLVASSSSASQDRKGDHLRLQSLVFLLMRSGLLKYTYLAWSTTKTEVTHRDLPSILHAYQEQEADEIDDLTKVRGRRDHYAPWTDPRSRRQELLRMLRTLPVNTWVGLRSFLDHAGAASAIDVLTEVSTLVGIGNDYETSMDALQDVGLQFLRDAWARVALYACLQPLGIIDVAVAQPEPLPKAIRLAAEEVEDFKDTLSPADTMSALRLTPLGAWLLGVGPEPEARRGESGGWTIQADGTVISLGQVVGVRERLLLDSVASRHDERSWRLERESLITTLAQGVTRETLQESLAQLSGKALPDAVLRLLDEAQRRAGAVSALGVLVVLQVQDRHGYEQLVHDRHTAKHCRDLGAGRIGVAPGEFSAFRRAARKLGWHIPDQAADQLDAHGR